MAAVSVTSSNIKLALPVLNLVVLLLGIKNDPDIPPSASLSKAPAPSGWVVKLFGDSNSTLAELILSKFPVLLTKLSILKLLKYAKWYAFGRNPIASKLTFLLLINGITATSIILSPNDVLIVSEATTLFTIELVVWSNPQTVNLPLVWENARLDVVVAPATVVSSPTSRPSISLPNQPHSDWSKRSAWSRFNLVPPSITFAAALWSTFHSSDWGDRFIDPLYIEIIYGLTFSVRDTTVWLIYSTSVYLM